MLLAALAAAGCTLISGPLLLGGALPWTVAVIAALATLWLSLATWAAHRREITVPPDAVTLACLVAFAWTGLQLLPLPFEWVKALAPETARQARLTADALGNEPPGLLALTQDPGSTRREVVKGVAILGSFVGGWLLIAMRRRQRLLELAGLSVVVFALVALGHRLANAETVFGLYDPENVSTRRLSPLMNENHAGGFLAMGVPLLLGLGVSEQDDRRRQIAWIIGAVLSGVMAILTLSRSGIAAALGGGVLFGAAVLLSPKRRDRRARPAHLATVLTVAGTLGISAYIAADAVISMFETQNTYKLIVIAQGLELTMDHFWIGVGRGAFSSAFVQELGSDVRFEHPENLVVQWASEWGIPVALGVLGVIGTVLLKRLRTTRSYARIAALAAVVTIAGQNLVDFGLEMAGIVVVAAPLLAATVFPQRRRSSDMNAKPRWQPSMRTTAVGLGGIAVILVGVLGPQLHAEASSVLRDRLETHLERRDHEAFAHTLKRAVKLHPAEPNLAVLAAAEALQRDDPAALRWLNRAMMLAPEWPWPHVATARWLLERGRLDQALLEIREAAERRSGAGSELMCRILKQEPRAELAFRAAPSGGMPRETFLDQVAQCGHGWSWARTIDERLVAQGTELIAPYRRSARRWLDRDEPEQAIDVLEKAVQSHPTAAKLYALLADACLQLGAPAHAADVLEKAPIRGKARRPLLRKLAETHVTTGDAEAMRDTVDALRRFAAGSGGELAEVATFRAKLELQLGNQGAALRAFEEARRLGGKDANTLPNVGRLAEKLGDPRRAYHAYSTLCRRRDGDGRYCRAASRVRKKLTEQGSSLSQHIQGLDPPGELLKARSPNADVEQ